MFIKLKVMPPAITKKRSLPLPPPYTLIIEELLDKSKDNLMMAYTQGRNM